MTDPLSDAEIHRWFQTAKRDRWYREQCPISQPGIALVLGQSASSGEIWRMIRGVRAASANSRDGVLKGLTEKLRHKAETLIRAVDEGRLIFWRQTKPIQWHFAWLDPPKTIALPQRSLVESEVWNYWRPCRTCGGRKWLPLMLTGGPREPNQPWIACYICHPPQSWPSFGARPRSEYLAARAVAEIVSGYGVFRSPVLALSQQTVRP